MSSKSTVILYDLPSKGRCACWSLNPWKTRLVLNYKDIPYKTEWTEYPDIEAKHKENGIPPNKEGPMPYAIPAVYIPDADGKKYMQDSRVIVEVLEKLHPNSPLHLDSPILPKVEALVPKIQGSLAPVLMPRVPRNILNSDSAEYFQRTRKERFGMPLDEFEKSEKGGEAAWKGADGPLKELAALLKENGGPFFMGKEISYADFVVLGALEFWKRLGQDIFDRVVGVDKAFAAFYQAGAPFAERDDH